MSTEKRIYTELGNRIRTVRTMRGMTQRELAENVGRSERTIEKYEAGTQKPSLLTLYRIADTLRTNIQRIVVSPSEWAAEQKQAVNKVIKKAVKAVKNKTKEVSRMAKAKSNSTTTTSNVNPQPKRGGSSAGRSSKAPTAGIKDGGARKVSRSTSKSKK